VVRDPRASRRALRALLGNADCRLQSRFLESRLPEEPREAGRLKGCGVLKRHSRIKPRSARHSAALRRGFTLLEVLIAFSILSITLVTLYQAYSANLLIHSSTRGVRGAMVYVNNELLRWERMPSVSLHVDQGAFPEGDPMFGYAWERHVTDETPLPGVTVRKVSLRLTWREGAREQAFQSEVYVQP
jgi:prepilin-type N-terminal cleavage/methylation domain-containing protein